MNANVDGAGRAGRVIWRREVEDDRIAGRWSKFLRFYVAPTAVVLLIGLIVGGAGTLFGMAILFGLFGLMLGALVWFKNLGAKQNETIVLDGDDLVFGRRRLDLRRVESWTTRADDVDWGVGSQLLFGNAMAGNSITAQVVFRLAVVDEHGRRGVRADGGAAFELVRLAWAEMPGDHLERLRHTIAPHIRAPYVTAEQLLL